MISPESLTSDLLARHPADTLGATILGLLPLLNQRLVEKRHGDFDRWLAALNALPRITPGFVSLNSAAIRVENEAPLPVEIQQPLETSLRGLMPWRKGPFSIFGTVIDTEWRSDLKWDRVHPHLSPLRGRRVLDVGCGSGYHCWRMAGDGAAEVLGIDPSLLFLFQFQAIKRYAGPQLAIDVLPLTCEELTGVRDHFDTVFSMGVLYHRKSPLDHLEELRQYLKPGGELVLETLVVDGPEGMALMPEDRYAMMRNVWFLPTPATAERWLARSGFDGIRVVDVTSTTTEEQRQTDWMRFQSLPDFLDPADPGRTIEGYPAPRRATLIARRR